MADAFPSPPSRPAASFDAAAFAELRKKNRCLTKLLTFHRGNPAQLERVVAEQRRVREAARSLIEGCLASALEPPPVTLSAEEFQRLCDAGARLEGLVASLTGLAPVQDQEAPVARLLAACDALCRASEYVRAKLLGAEGQARAAAARAAEAAAAAERREAVSRERHAAFQAEARELAPALADLHGKLEVARVVLRLARSEAHRCKTDTVRHEGALLKRDAEIWELRGSLAAAKERLRACQSRSAAPTDLQIQAQAPPPKRRRPAADADDLYV